MKHKLILLALVTFSLSLSARHISLKLGEKISIGGDTIACDGDSNNTSTDVVFCDDFHSSNECQKLKIGTECSVNNQLGKCVQQSVFGGKSVCKCVERRK